MSTIRGFQFNEVKPQPGFTATQGENGGWTGRHTFAITRTSWANAAVRSRFQKGTQITSLDPDLDSFFDFMRVVTVEVESEEGDFIFVTTSISGAQGSQFGDEGGLGSNAEPTYRLSGSLQDAPLSQHSKWAGMSSEDKEFLGRMIVGEATFVPGDTNYIVVTFDLPDDVSGPELVREHEVTGDALEFATRIARGETTYEKPVFTWTEMTQGTESLTGGQINALGRISTPRGNPPEPNGSRDWKLTAAMQEQVGQQITTDLEWTLSERGGHDSFLYDE